MQITYLHHLTFQGGKVAHIEGVRIHKDHQSKGLGTQMFQWGFERIKNQGCHRVQLMTDKKRGSAKKCKFSKSHGKWTNWNFMDNCSLSDCGSNSF